MPPARIFGTKSALFPNMPENHRVSIRGQPTFAEDCRNVGAAQNQTRSNMLLETFGDDSVVKEVPRDQAAMELLGSARRQQSESEAFMSEI